MLTATDFNAIALNDSNYINSKGVENYSAENYSAAAEYYHLAAAMGNSHAISNLGYCYLYGRHTEKDLGLALGYFKIAAGLGEIDAAYKLGDVYGNEKWGCRDTEMSVYYYRMAASFIISNEWNAQTIHWNDGLEKYPSLCFALARETAPEGAMVTDLECSYEFLLHAREGYEMELANGNSFYQKAFEDVLRLLEDPMYDKVKKLHEQYFDEDTEE